jgi:fibronectin type 3 domain-containing protein
MGKIRFICKMQLLAVLSMVMLSSGCGSSSSSSTPPDTTAPAAPTYLTAVAASDTTVSLRWAASSDNVSVTGYNIYRDSVQITSTSTTTTVYSDNTCTFSKTYSYTVAAHDAANNVSALSSSATTTTFDYGSADNLKPDPPANLLVTASTSTQISLSWNTATDNKGVSGYNIYRGTIPLGSKTIVGTTTTTSYSDTGLTTGITYYYAVTAFDGVPKESDASNERSATTQ